MQSMNIVEDHFVMPPFPIIDNHPDLPYTNPRFNFEGRVSNEKIIDF